MAAGRVAWGIDVGNRALKAVKLVRDGDAFRLDDFAVIEHETILSQSGDNRDSLVTKALSEFVGRHAVKGAPVGITVSGQQSFARFVKLPPVEAKKIPEIVRFEAIQQIPFPLDDVEWAYQLFQSEGNPDVEVGIFAMRKELVNRHVGFYTDVDLNVQVVQMSPLAVYNAMVHDGKLAEGGATMIVDLGAETTDLIIADGEQVWMRSIPIGGNKFTESLERGFKINFAKAEEEKRSAATSKYARQIFQQMRPVFADLVAEIQRSVGFYSSTHRESKIVKAIALGGTFKLPGLQKYLQQNLQLEVERLEGFSAGLPADARVAAALGDNALSAAGAYGLALQAMGEAKITSSLLPSHIRREKVWRDKTKWFVASAAIVVAAAGVAAASSVMNSGAYDAASGERDQIATIHNTAKGFDSRWSGVAGAGATERQTIMNVRSLAADRALWARLLTDLRRAVPEPGDPAKTARRQRPDIHIDSITSVYGSDMGKAVRDDDMAKYFTGDAPRNEGDPSEEMGMPVPMAMPSAGPTGAAGASQIATLSTGKAGFYVTIRGVTPNREGVAYVQNAFVNRLLEIGVKPGSPRQGYFVAKAVVLRAVEVRKDASRLQAMQKSYGDWLKMRPTPPPPEPGTPGADGGTGLGGVVVPNTPPPAPAADDATPYLDPVTNEDMRDDILFTVGLIVVVADFPTPAPAPATP